MLRWLADVPRSHWLVVALLALTGVLLQQTGLTEPLDRLLFDTGSRINRKFRPLPVENDILIVGMDERFLDSVDEPLSLSHVYLSRFLHAMAKAKPAVIGIDMALPEKRFHTITLAAQPGMDLHRTLVGSLLEVSRDVPIVTAKVWDDNRRQFRDIQVDFVTVLSMQPRGAKAHASALFFEDADRRIRHYPGSDFQPGGIDSTFTSEVAAAMGVKKPWAGLIDFQVGGSFTYLPMKEVLELAARGDDGTLKRLFAARVVLLGTALDDIDLLSVPVPIAAWRPGEQRVPGVAVHAQVLRNMLGRGFIQPASGWIVTVLSVLAAFLWLGAPIARKFAAFGGAAALLLALSWQLLYDGTWLAPGAALLTGALACSARGALEGWRNWRERRRLSATFAGYVSPAVMAEILKEGASHQQSRKAQVCVLFSDIRNFTTLSERMPAEDVVALLNRYFARMTAIVHRHGGTVDKFIGDGLMAFFGAPNVLPSPARAALNAARDMLEELAALNREFEAEGRKPIAIGVGLHLGEAVIGSIGSPERHEYTAIGDSVNTASRLEGLCKELGYPVIVSDAVAQAVGTGAGLQPLGAQAVKGRSAVTVYGWRPATQNARKDDEGEGNDDAHDPQLPARDDAVLHGLAGAGGR